MIVAGIWVQADASIAPGTGAGTGYYTGRRSTNNAG